MLAPFFWFMGLLGAARDLQSRAFILEFFVSPRWGSSFSHFIFPRPPRRTGLLMVRSYGARKSYQKIKMFYPRARFVLPYPSFAAPAPLREY
jgi:hypothetical protein